MQLLVDLLGGVDLVVLHLEEFLDLSGNAADQVVLELLLEEWRVVPVLFLVVLEIVQVQEDPLGRIEGSLTLLNELLRVIVLLVLPHLDHDHRKGQVGCPQQLVERILEIVDHADHHENEDEVVLDSANFVLACCCTLLVVLGALSIFILLILFILLFFFIILDVVAVLPIAFVVEGLVHFSLREVTYEFQDFLEKYG